ncbi:MAG: iron ABC transporter permease [Treponema sp.]|nr:iron ABC transporter permease [Treponema sp.]
MKLRVKFIIACAAAFLILLAGVSLGSSNIPLKDTAGTLLEKLFGLPAKTESRIVTIVWNLRFPRAILAFLAGGALAISGGVFQSVLKNPLASPFIIGVSSGASLGAGLVMLTGFALPFIGAFTLPLSGFFFGLLTVFMVIGFSSRLDKSMSNNTIILFGMVFSLFINAILTTLTALNREELRNLLYWQMGTFSMKDWTYSGLLLPFLAAGCAAVILYSREMDILSFGEEEAQSMGVNAVRVRRTLLACAAAMTGACVALCGVIGFVDLIAPHLARRITGSRHCYSLPMAFIIGGSLMVVTDLIARTIVSPSELPVGAVTALIGGPFFAWVYFGKRRSGAGA